MIAVDTNVIVRALAGDDPIQSPKARDLLRREGIYVSATVLLETEWVLRSSYRLPAAKAIDLLSALISPANVILQDRERVSTALAWARKGMDFADALHLSVAEGCTEFASFDRALVRVARGLETMPVRAP